MRISLRSRSSAATTPVPPELRVLPVLRARPARREFPALTVLRVPLVPPDLPGQSVRWVLPVLLALRDLQASRGLSVPPVPPGRPVPRVRWVLSVPPGGDWASWASARGQMTFVVRNHNTAGYTDPVEAGVVCANAN